MHLFLSTSNNGIDRTPLFSPTRPKYRLDRSVLWQRLCLYTLIPKSARHRLFRPLRGPSYHKSPRGQQETRSSRTALEGNSSHARPVVSSKNTTLATLQSMWHPLLPMVCLCNAQTVRAELRGDGSGGVLCVRSRSPVATLFGDTRTRVLR